MTLNCANHVVQIIMMAPGMLAKPTYMTENKLQLKTNKTEAVLFNFSILKHPLAPL